MFAMKFPAAAEAQLRKTIDPLINFHDKTR